MFFFFFKQRTAYEMRISDWSSDVCSSDLSFARPGRSDSAAVSALKIFTDVESVAMISPGAAPSSRAILSPIRRGAVDHSAPSHERSEEHTSELQSLMRISYAVFCLKKKTTCTYSNSSATTK